MNKRGTTLAEVCAGVILMGILVLMISMLNSALVQTRHDIEDARVGADSYDYVINQLVSQVKSANGSYSIESDVIRLYRPDGTYGTIEKRNGHLYILNEKVCRVGTWRVDKLTDGIRVTADLDNAAPIYLTLYSEPLDGGAS